MSKAIMISIKPKWVAKILNGEKTIEVRKKFPAYVGWVYIYCTKDNKQRLYPVALLDKSNQVFKRAYREDKIDNRVNYLNGKVVARFWCDKVNEYINGGNWTKYKQDNGVLDFTDYLNDDVLGKSCLTEDELYDYCEDLAFKAIYITKLEIFDKPKELSEFEIRVFPYRKGNLFTRYLTKAPQSWCWVEEEPQ